MYVKLNERNVLFFPLKFFFFFFFYSWPTILKLVAKCTGLGSSFCHHHHLSTSTYIRKGIPTPNHHYYQRHTKVLKDYLPKET